MIRPWKVRWHDINLKEHIKSSILRGRRALYCVHQPWSVDRVHKVCPANNLRRFIGLHLPDAVPGQRQVVQFSPLGEALSGAAFTDIRYSQFTENSDVVRRESFGDGNKSD